MLLHVTPFQAVSVCGILQSISCPSEEARERLHGANCGELFGILGAQWFARDSLKFNKRCQLFIHTHNETLSVIAVCVCNEDRSPVRVDSCDTAPTPTGFAEFVGEAGRASPSVLPRQSCPYAREENTARTKLRHNLIGTIGCSGSDKTVQNLTDCADRNRAGQTLRKDFTGSRAFVCAGISLVNSPIEKREGVYWYERDRETTNNGADRA
jgi:hypothetical protein